MPPLRLGSRNEFGLGNPELCKGAARKEDEEEPKAVFDGAAVAGLVGILRLLGDLAEFAANVFNDLHEQITSTRIKGRKMMTRVRNIDAALPPVEKALKGQQSHIRLTYVEGIDWHGCLQDEQSLLRSSELPQFMMDSYEECRGPPRLYLLDKFEQDGNGACLRRYSDPSYFRRIRAASQMENTRNLRVDEKLQKIKRKESQKRKGGAQHAGYVSWHDTSLIFSSPSIGRQRFFVENVSSPDIKIDIDFSSRSASPCSKSKVTYAESSVGPPLMAASALDVDDGQSADRMDDLTPHDSLNEESIPRSSFITWDEKIEFVKLTSPACSYDDIHVDRVQDSQDVIRDQDSQSQPLEMDSEPEVTDYAETEVLDRARILFDISNVSGPLSGANHSDEVIGEADDYVDALNTLDSETETEAGCCTKREVKPLPSLSSQRTAPVLTLQHSDFYAVDQAQVLDVRSSHFSSSDGLEHVQSPYAPEFLQNQEFSATNGRSEESAHGVSQSQSTVDIWVTPSSGTSSSPAMKVIECTSEVCTMKNPPISVVTGAPTIHLWTNGGLFGVEPSKPPELGVVNIIQSEKPAFGSKNISSDCSVELNVTSDATSLKNKPASLGFSHELKVHGEHNNLSSSVHGSSINGRLYARGYSAVKGCEGSASGNGNHHCDSDDRPESQGSLQHLSQTAFVKSSDQETSIISNCSVGPRRVNMTTDSASSSFSELARKFLINTLQRKVALSTHSGSSIEIGKSEETSPYHSKVSPNGAALLEACYKEHIDEKVAHVSPESPLVPSTSHYPEQSSPSLEYMKISFHPINGLENSKLKLELSSADLHDSSDDYVVPSFQLFQGRDEPDVSSESDDDTFCRSCPYSSESPRSYSNSEQWEEDEKSECINPQLNDVDRRFESSSSTPISRPMQFEQMHHSNMGAPRVSGELDARNSEENFQAKSRADFPGLESVILENQQQQIFHSSPETPSQIEAQSKVEPPPPPPLPPVQWTTKPSAASKSNDAIDHLDRPQVIQCSQREERPPPKSPSAVAAIPSDSNGKKQNEQTLNSKKGLPKRSAIHKETDPREDFLHQIRNQSFNLRRTERPAAKRDVLNSTKNVADVNVAAILEKASAIRQAFVGSDDGGEDGNWSGV